MSTRARTRGIARRAPQDLARQSPGQSAVPAPLTAATVSGAPALPRIHSRDVARAALQLSRPRSASLTLSRPRTPASRAPHANPTPASLAGEMPPGRRTWRTRSDARQPLSTSSTSSIDLVWRAASPDTKRSASAPGAHDVPDAPTRELPRASDTTALAPELLRKEVRATVLDPVLVERVAADVIRRIDQRARIELERRGM